MKTFDYRGFDASGRSSRGLVEALDLKEAREKLAARGILPEKVHPAGRTAPGFSRHWKTGFDLAARAALYRELGALLRAGLPLANALEVLIAAPELGNQRTDLAGVHDRIREGSSFAGALAAASEKITPFERAVVEVGERAGSLETVLDRLAGFLEQEERVQERVQTALIYPLIVVAVAVVVAVLMLGVMIPRVGQILRETSVPLPLLTRATMACGRWILPIGLPVLGLGVLLAAWFRVRIRREPEGQADWDRKLFGFPLVSRAYTALVNLRFARTLALLLEGGVPLTEGIGLAGRATGSPWIARLSGEAAEAVRHGRSLADAVRAIPPLSGSLPGWIQAGEASGKLEDLLESAGNRFQQQWDRLIARSLSILEPLLILAVGGFVLVIALSILLPILSLNKTLM